MGLAAVGVVSIVRTVQKKLKGETTPESRCEEAAADVSATLPADSAS